MHRGPTCLIATRRTKLVTDDSSNGRRSGILKGIFEALAADLQAQGVLDVTEAFIDGSFAPAKKGHQGWEGEAR